MKNDTLGNSNIVEVLETHMCLVNIKGSFTITGQMNKWSWNDNHYWNGTSGSIINKNLMTSIALFSHFGGFLLVF